MIWTIVAITTITVVSVKLFQRLTCGVCRSKAHMAGKVVIVTGGNSGMGFETAKNLAERGARVIIACRSTHKGIVAKEEIIQATGNPDVHWRLLDLSSLHSIHQFSDNILKTEKQLDVLINNASVCGLGNHITKDGLHLGMQVNYYGPFLLTCLLLPLLKSSAPSRIVNVSSVAHKFAVVDFDNLNMERYWSDYLVFANSKLYINLMTLELSRRLKGTGVTVNSLHPGNSATNILRNIPSDAVRKAVKKGVGFMYFNSWEAAQTILHLAVSPELEDVSGRYYSNCRESRPSTVSRDIKLAQKLWSESEKLVKYSLPYKT